MKVLRTVELAFTHVAEDYDDEDVDKTHTIGRRRYNILNRQGLNDAVNNMASSSKRKD